MLIPDSWEFVMQFGFEDTYNHLIFRFSVLDSITMFLAIEIYAVAACYTLSGYQC